MASALLANNHYHTEKPLLSHKFMTVQDALTIVFAFASHLSSRILLCSSPVRGSAAALFCCFAAMGDDRADGVRSRRRVRLLRKIFDKKAPRYLSIRDAAYFHGFARLHDNS